MSAVPHRPGRRPPWLHPEDRNPAKPDLGPGTRAGATTHQPTRASLPTLTISSWSAGYGAPGAG